MTAAGSTAARGATSTASVTRFLPFVALAAAVVVIGLLTQGGRRQGEPLDPRSTEPLGARALVLLLEKYGASVQVSSVLPGESGTAVVLWDQLNARETTKLRAWVDRGGTLVVADPFSDMAPVLERGSGSLLDTDVDGEVLQPRCTLPLVRGIDRVEVPGAAPLRIPRGGTGCFPVGGGYFLVATASGAGEILAVGGGGAFVNSQLADADNALFAISLMASRPGTAVHILEASAAGSGDQNLFALVSRRVKDGLWQLLIAFVIFAVWRARRLGRPIVETQPVQIAGSELAVAVGNLLQQAGRRDEAAAMLRFSLTRTLGERLGLSTDSPPEQLAEAAASRTGCDRDALARALSRTRPANDAELVTLAQSVAALRNEVTHAR